MSVVRNRRVHSNATPRRGLQNWSHYLAGDEELLWQSGPASGLRFKFNDIFISLFGAVFMGFAYFWMGLAEVMTSQHRMQGTNGGPAQFIQFFPLFGYPFLVVGFYVFVGRYFWSAFVRSRTGYALTNKRAMISTKILQPSLKTYPITAETQLEYVQGDEADIWFHREQRRGSKGRKYTVKKGFQFLRDGDRVYRMMLEVQRDDRKKNR